MLVLVSLLHASVFLFVVVVDVLVRTSRCSPSPSSSSLARRWLVVGSSVVCMHVSASAAASVAPRRDATRRLERDELYIIVAPGDAARSTGTSSGSGLLFLRRNRERWSSGTMEKEVQWETGNDIERKREKTESEKEGERGESGILHSSAGLDGREYGYYRWDAF